MSRLTLLLSSLLLLSLAPACDNSPSDNSSTACGYVPGDGCATCITNPADPAYGSCGGYLYECNDGSWEQVGYCEPWPLRPYGLWSLTHTETDRSASCPAAEVQGELMFSVTRRYELEAVEPDVVVIEAWVSEGFQRSTGGLTISTSWPIPGADPAAVTISYDLLFAWDGDITGTATAELDAACTIELDISGAHTQR